MASDPITQKEQSKLYPPQRKRGKNMTSSYAVYHINRRFKKLTLILVDKNIHEL